MAAPGVTLFNANQKPAAPAPLPTGNIDREAQDYCAPRIAANEVVSFAGRDVTIVGRTTAHDPENGVVTLSCVSTSTEFTVVGVGAENDISQIMEMTVHVGQDHRLVFVSCGMLSDELDVPSYCKLLDLIRNRHRDLFF